MLPSLANRSLPHAMNSYPFRILNVFAEQRLGGNPLCVFEDGEGLDDATMQALAQQFNLSETTFILPSAEADARVRIFTTGYEMRFAGHPTLGTAEVVRDLKRCGDTLSLEVKAGRVPVTADGSRWTLTAPSHGAPKRKIPEQAPREIAAMLGLSESDLLDAPCWIDTGTDQLLLPLNSVDAVRRAAPDGSRLEQWPLSSQKRRSAYLFAFDQERPGTVVCRYFFTKDGGGVAEDPGTGSACANLGGWLIATGKPTPARFLLEQGDLVGRPCRLELNVLADGAITVGGRVIELGRGAIQL
jgi:PhzF family phenazine biosynthesis protein